MDFHICSIGYVFGIPVLLFWEVLPNDQVILVLNSTSTNPTLVHVMPVNAADNDQDIIVLNSTSTNPSLLHVRPVNAAASRASPSRLN